MGTFERKGFFVWRSVVCTGVVFYLFGCLLKVVKNYFSAKQKKTNLSILPAFIYNSCVSFGFFSLEHLFTYFILYHILIKVLHKHILKTFNNLTYIFLKNYKIIILYL